ncbi:hypothetical protein [Paenibacillus sp. FSL H3-0469]|uniref:hypothetical protein n=1 Tax=Paenibacillus sp. FSL H3-0469 TaxID=2954506 RepID=UPI003100F91A
MYDYVVHLLSVKFSKKRPYTLVFTGLFTNAHDREITFEYNGTEIVYISSVAYIAEVNAQLLKELNEDYGYGPFDKNESTKQFKLKQRYYFEYD